MRFRRPIIKVDAETSLSDSVRLLLPCFSPNAEPVLLCCPPDRTEWRLNRQLDSWKCVDAAFERIQGQARTLAREISRLGFPTTIEHGSDPGISGLIEAGAYFDADLLVTPRAVRCRKSMTYFSCPEEDLIVRSPVPVWVSGTSTKDESPIVVALDPSGPVEDFATEFSGLINTGLSLSQSDDLNSRKIIFVAVDELEQGDSERRRLFDFLRMAVLEHWLKQSGQLEIDDAVGIRFGASGPFQMKFANGDSGTFESIIQEANPACVVIGRPTRSEFDRCFHPGMLRRALEYGCHLIQPAPLNSAVDSQTPVVAHKDNVG